MTPRKRLVACLKRDVPVSLHAYKDQLGYTRIGMHRAIDYRIAGGLSEREADILLHNDLDAIEDQLRSKFPYAYRLTTARTNALIDLALALSYSMAGVDGLLAHTALVSSIQRGEFMLAAELVRTSPLAKSQPHRAERLAKMLMSGQWPDEWKDSR